MGNFLSADTYIIERDLSLTVTPVATGIGVYVGRSTKGPVWEKTLVSKERQFADLFGDPTDSNYEDFFTAAGFLQYGSNLYYTRVVGSDALNSEINVTTTAASGDLGAYIPDWEDYTPTFGGDDKVQFYAKYPGDYGNTEFKIALVNYADYVTPTQTTSAYDDLIDEGPSSSDEFVVLVYGIDPNGDYEFAEQWLVSDTANKKDNRGNNMYVNQKINNGSEYILAFNNTGNSGSPVSFEPMLATSGSDGTDVEADIVTAYDLYNNKEDIEINYLIGGSHTTVSTASAIIAIADTNRKDCTFAIDVPKSDVVNVANISTAIDNVLDYRRTELNANSSYGALYGNWLYVYDKYNDVNRWVPSSGHIAGVYANTAQVADRWFAPAGLNRGQLKNVIKLAINPDKTYRDAMYKYQVNPIVAFPGQGTVVWGQKTLLTAGSAFDRINVRELFLGIEIAIARAARNIIWDQNDELTRTIFRNLVVPFLDDVKGRRGIDDFVVDVSDTVNNSERIARNEFWSEIYVKPTYAAEFIILRFNSVKGGISLSELT